jgi:hypothetical protein
VPGVLHGVEATLAESNPLFLSVGQCGGFSMVSEPSQLPLLSLAVKRADFAPPAYWVHNQAKVRGGRGRELNTPP